LIYITVKNDFGHLNAGSFELNLNYQYIKLNNILIESRKNRLFEAIFSLYLKRLLKKHFHKIHLSGTENFSGIDAAIPTIAYVNHSNWWDGFIAFYLAKEIWNVDSYLMMDIEQMEKYKFFRRLGVFSVDRNSPQSAMESIDYAAQLLKNSNWLLWIFPQGVLLPNDTRPLRFYTGVSAIVEKLGCVNLIPFAMKYEYMMEQRAEIFLQLGKAEKIEEPVKDKKEFTSGLQNNLTMELESLRSKITANDLESFQTIFYGKDSRNKTIDKLHA
jgi:chlorobactene lauroyltransferase